MVMEIGLRLPQVYEILGGPYQGGMGCVWQARHREWGTLLAVKQPIADTIEDPRVRERFLHECELWVSLGLHEHIVFCHYVRDVQGVFTVFAEWMEGGSLQEQIVSETLYEAASEDSRTRQLRILDIAIQIARGMAYAHSRKLIHRDLKPGNILFSAEGTVKITDFGLSSLYGDEDISKGFGTAAYAAPEQQRGESVTPQADLWSFGVLLLELFLGERLWANCRYVPAGLEQYWRQCRVPVPEPVKRLIRSCCSLAPQQRPSGFCEAEELLLSCWQQLAGREYPRRNCGTAGLKADSWNNRALSYLDLGRMEEAEACWDKALRADPGHMASQYNRTMCHWRAGRLDDLAAMRCLQNAYNNTPCLENAELLLRFFTERQSAEPIAKLVALYKGALTPPADASWDNRLLLTTEPVRAVACAAQGAVLFCRDGASVWDPASGARACSLELGADAGNDAVFLANGHLCVATDGGLQLFDRNGKRLKSLSVSEGAVRQLFCCADDQTLLHVSRRDREVNKEYAIRLRLPDGGRCGKIRFDQVDPELFLVLHDGRELIVSTREQLLRVRMADGAILNHYAVAGAVRCAALSGDEAMLAAADDDAVFLLSTADGERRRMLPDSGCTALHFLRGSALLLTAARRTVRLWEVSTGRCLRTFPPHRAAVTALAVSADGEYYLSAASDGVFLQCIPPFRERALWKLSGISDVRRLQENEQRFRQLLEDAAAYARKGEIAEALRCLGSARAISGYERHPAYLKLNAKLGRRLHPRRLLSVWSRHTETREPDRQKAPDPLTSANEKATLTARYDGAVRLGGMMGERTVRSGIRGVSAATLAENGSCFALGTFHGVLALFDAKSGALRWQRRHGGNMVTAMCFDPTGGFLLAGYAEGTLIVCDGADGRRLKVLSGHTAPVTALRFSPDGLMLRSDGEDGSVRIWQFDYEYEI